MNIESLKITAKHHPAPALNLVKKNELFFFFLAEESKISSVFEDLVTNVTNA